MLERFTVSMEEALLKKFERYIKRRGYVSRSEAVRDLIRNTLIEDAIEENENTEIFGTITMIYDHEVKGITDRITHIQHGYLREIRSAVHVHVDRKNCLEVVIFHGKAKKLREIVDKLSTMKGVKNVRFVFTRVEP